MTIENKIDGLICRSLTAFAADVLSRGSSWRGRERENISLYAFGYLIQQCEPGGVLHDPTQLGIEVAVPQFRGAGKKPQVCKDLVIWPTPRMTVWYDAGSPANRPLSILQWKAGEAPDSDVDIVWLKRFSRGADSFVGYSICFIRGNRVTVARIRNGIVGKGWLNLPAG